MTATEEQDHYKILGVSKNATDLEIKRAYRKQALKFHPDRNKEMGAHEKFQKIGQAFEVLSDKDKRQQHDEHHDNNNINSYSSPCYSTSAATDLFAQFFSNGSSSFTNNDANSSDDDDDFFKLFGSASSNRITTPPYSPPQKPSSVKRKLHVSLDDLYTGTTKKLKVTRSIYDQQSGQCTASDKILTIHVVPGWRSGTKIKFSGEGDSYGPQKQQQDIEFEIQEKPHATFIRREDNLFTTMHLTLSEALTGFEKKLTKLDETKLVLRQEEIVHSGQEKILIGEGMPIYKTKEKGDLIIQFQVDFPKSLTLEQKSTLKQVLAI